MDKVEIAGEWARGEAATAAETLMARLSLRTGITVSTQGYMLFLSQEKNLVKISVQKKGREPLGVLLLTYCGQRCLMSASYSKIRGKEAEPAPRFVLDFLAQLRRVIANEKARRPDGAAARRRTGYRDAAQRELGI